MIKMAVFNNKVKAAALFVGIVWLLYGSQQTNFDIKTRYHFGKRPKGFTGADITAGVPKGGFGGQTGGGPAYEDTRQYAASGQQFLYGEKGQGMSYSRPLDVSN